MKRTSTRALPVAAGGLCILLVALNVSIGHITAPKHPSERGLLQHTAASPIASKNGNSSQAQTAPVQARSMPSATDRVHPAAKSSSVFTDLQELVVGSSSNTKTAIDKDHDGVQVWISKGNGYYYCADSRYYGRLQPGGLMMQGKALQSGYQPKLSQLCD